MVSQNGSFYSIRWVSWLCLLIVLAQGPRWAIADEIDFNRDIRPVLAEHCLHCHGPDASQRKASLRLDSRSHAIQSAIVPGDALKSPLVDRITSRDPDEVMPPPSSGKSLTAKQIDLLKTWIDQGAEFQTHWALRPVQAPKLPARTLGRGHPIDLILRAKLREHELSYAPALTRQQLIRRATFDLVGLPPTIAEVEAFVYDPAPDAFEKVIDRLLSSEHYGERWGRHWLDLARYADTLGGAAIGFQRFPFSYTYRDYVIRSFNTDLPYNQFLTEQIAADQLGLPPNDPALAALGFLTVGQQFRNPNDTIDDQIDVVTRGIMGLTVTCARCHDHKYDAIPTSDYYSFYAIFASSEKPSTLPTVGVPAHDQPGYRAYQNKLQALETDHRDLARDQNAVMRGRLRMQVGMYLRELAKGTPEQDLTAQFLSYRTDDLRPHILEAWRRYLNRLPDTDSVFGPWHHLSRLSAPSFAEECERLLDEWEKQNGEKASGQAWYRLGTKAPRWNPRVLETLRETLPQNLLDVADAYGELFANVHREWLRALLQTSEEALPGRKPVPDEAQEHAVVNSAVNRELRRHLFERGTPLALPEAEASRFLNRPIRDNVSGRAGAITQLNLNAPGSPPRAMVMNETSSEGEFFVMRRGNPLDRGERVQARFLTALEGVGPEDFPPGRRRLALAKAVTDPENPLTRRVVVNWVWQHHFGVGLVRTPDDFGIRGKPPTHPELLDYLATKLMEEDWSLKKLHRHIMLSGAYRQGTVENEAARAVDPDNRWLWRMPRRRLDVEAMRDAMLSVSGELDRQVGGRPFELSNHPIVPRRTVYALVNRDIVTPFFSTFDAANPTSCTAQRTETNVPQQTLYALNSSFIQDRALALAQHPLVAAGKTREERFRRLHERALSRPPEPAEVALALEYLEEGSPEKENERWAQLAHALLASNEFVFVD